MQKMKVVIADDERLSRRALRAQLEQLDAFSIVAECADGVTTLAAIEREAPDLVFLDIQMPRLNGFQVLERLAPEMRPAVIFVTAYDEHAIHAFEVRALDYVLKPFDGQRLRAACEHALTSRRERELSARMETLLEAVQRDEHAAGSAGPTRRLMVRQAGCSFFVPTAAIDWIEALGNYVRLHVGDQTHVLQASMTETRAQARPGGFHADPSVDDREPRPHSARRTLRRLGLPGGTARRRASARE